MKLPQLRKEAGLTLRKVSAICDITPSTLSLAESGKRNLSSSQIMCLAQLFDVSESYLLGESDSWIRVYNEYDDFFYKLTEKQYASLREKDAVDVVVERSRKQVHFYTRHSPIHKVSRTVFEQYGKELAEKYPIDFEETMNSLSSREKEEVMDYVRKELRK